MVSSTPWPAAPENHPGATFHLCLSVCLSVSLSRNHYPDQEYLPIGPWWDQGTHFHYALTVMLVGPAWAVKLLCTDTAARGYTVWPCMASVTMGDFQSSAVYFPIKFPEGRWEMKQNRARLPHNANKCSGKDHRSNDGSFPKLLYGHICILLQKWFSLALELSFSLLSL